MLVVYDLGMTNSPSDIIETYKRQKDRIRIETTELLVEKAVRDFF